MNALRMLTLVAAALLSLGASAQEAKPSLVIYISPQEYDHPVHLGTPPYFSRWIARGPLVEAAGKSAFQPLFGEISTCEGVNGGDVIVWLRPGLFYNVGARRYFARIKAQFHAANGRQLGVIKADHDVGGDMLALDMERQVQDIFDITLQDVARQYAADTTLQQAVADSRAQDVTHSPCAMVGAIPNP